jgi:2-methylisocitrate lyase-like PEP mutase family enzyme
MTPNDAAARFRELHLRGDPLVLYNVWDAGGAKALADAGARAIGTGSWSMAAAHGFADGQIMPLERVLWIVERIARSVAVPVTVDFEGGYAIDPPAVEENVRRVIGVGAIGINFEDRVVGQAGLHAVDVQRRRIEACRLAAEREGTSLFVNARTDLFLQAADRAAHPDLMADALARLSLYADAGADGVFAPGLDAPDLIERLCAASSRPVNVMMTGSKVSVADMAALGVSRASFGPAPFLSAISDLAARAAEAGALSRRVDA